MPRFHYLCSLKVTTGLLPWKFSESSIMQDTQASIEQPETSPGIVAMSSQEAYTRLRAHEQQDRIVQNVAFSFGGNYNPGVV